MRSKRIKPAPKAIKELVEFYIAVEKAKDEEDFNRYLTDTTKLQRISIFLKYFSDALKI